MPRDKTGVTEMSLFDVELRKMQTVLLYLNGLGDIEKKNIYAL